MDEKRRTLLCLEKDLVVFGRKLTVPSQSGGEKKRGKMWKTHKNILEGLSSTLTAAPSVAKIRSLVRVQREGSRLMGSIVSASSGLGAFAYEQSWVCGGGGEDESTSQSTGGVTGELVKAGKYFIHFRGGRVGSWDCFRTAIDFVSENEDRKKCKKGKNWGGRLSKNKKTMEIYIREERNSELDFFSKTHSERESSNIFKIKYIKIQDTKRQEEKEGSWTLNGPEPLNQVRAIKSGGEKNDWLARGRLDQFA